MELSVYRDEPNPPPVTEVIIRLEPEEAKMLWYLFGNVSRNKMADIVGEDKVDKTICLTNSIYWAMSDKGV